MKILHTSFVILILLIFWPHGNAMACGGMTTVNPPPLLRVTGPTLNNRVPDLPEYTCEIRVLDLQTFRASAGENCGCGIGLSEGLDVEVNELIQGAVLVEAGTSNPLEGFGFFRPNNTAAQFSSTSVGEFPALQVSSAFAGKWFTGRTVTTQEIKDGQRVDMVFLANTTFSCGELARKIGENNAVVLGVTDRNGLFNDPAHFDFAVSLQVEKISNPVVIISIATVLVAITGALFVIWRRHTQSQ